MRGKLVVLSALMLSGCGTLGPSNPNTGWLFQIGSPSVVQVPVVATQTTGDVQAMTLGGHVTAPMVSDAPSSGRSPARALPVGPAAPKAAVPKDCEQ